MDCPAIDDIVLIGSENDLERLREIGETYGGGKVRDVVLGGSDRQESVRNGLAACPNAEYVVIHDGARPCVTSALLDATLRAAQSGGCATAAVPISDSLLRESRPPAQRGETLLVCGGPPVSRDGLWAIQTPQAFDAPRLQEAHRTAQADGFAGTDDTSVYTRLHDGEPVRLVVGLPENIKVTRPEDMAIVEAVLEKRFSQGGSKSPPFRIGYGYDVHPFAPVGDGRNLYLGGVAFPEHSQALAGHSDADVLLHALCDALLGAAGLPDIGHYFPPSDAKHKNRSSLEFLTEVAALLMKNNWRVGNADMTVIAEAPKIIKRVGEMKAKIAVVLDISQNAVGIKATTSEGLGFIGRGEGIAAHATVLLVRP